MTIEEFILARVQEFRRGAMPLIPGADTTKWRTYLAIEEIVDWHKRWPVLVETEPKFEAVGIDGSVRDGVAHINEYAIRMSQQIQWFTQEQYRAAFGEEPPTAPIIKMLAKIWYEHEDFNQEWL